MLVKAVEAEVTAYIEAHQHEVDENGRRLVVRNGHARERTIVSGAGQLKIQAPRVDDRRTDERGQRFRFTSEILPPYLRRTKSVEELIPWLYLKGIATGDFSEALEALLGPDAPGLSAATVVRLKDVWRREYEAWSKRDLSGQRFVYIWADGIYSNVRLDDERQCLLVVMGALEDGPQATAGGARRLSRKRAVVEGVARGLETAGARAAAEVGGRRRRDGFLGGLAEGLSSNPGAALLAPQDGQRAQ